MYVYRTELARFRLRVSPFNAHRLRYSLSEASRACPFCTDKVDEVHVIFECYEHENNRNVYVNKLQDVSFQEQVISIKKSTPENGLVGLGQKTCFQQSKGFRKDLFLAEQMLQKRLENVVQPV